MPYGTFDENFKKVVDAVLALKQKAQSRFISGTDLKKYLMETSGLSKPVIIHYLPFLQVKGLIRKLGYNSYDLFPEYGDLYIKVTSTQEQTEKEKKEVVQ
jgi:hypothetical protein